MSERNLGAAAQLSRKYELGPSSNIFTALLPDGSFYPDCVGLEDARPLEFAAFYDTVRSKPWPECMILDLGCGEGSSSVALGRTGARVIGLDGRADVIRRGEFLRDALGYRNVELRVGSVLDAALWPDADAVFASGLIHHLADPFALLRMLGERCREFVYFCTHLAPASEAQGRASFFGPQIREFGTALDGEHRSWGCRVAEDPDLREDQGTRRRHPRSGIGNAHSWWPGLEDFAAALRRAGFAHQRRIHEHAHRLRHRLCFARNRPIGEPRSLQDVLVQPWPARLDRRSATERAEAADARFLVGLERPAAILGPQPALERICARLRAGQIAVGETFAMRETGPLRCGDWAAAADAAARSGNPYAILAASAFADLRQGYQACLLRGAFRYVFSSFALRSAESFPALLDPVTGEQIKLEPEGGMLF